MIRYFSLVVALAAGCAPENLGDPLPSDTDSPGFNDTDTDGDSDTDTDADTDTDIDTEPDTEPIDPATAMCNEWSDRIDDNAEGTWTGDVATCTAGTLSADGITSILNEVNAIRWLSGQPEVTDAPEQNAAAQECSLLMKANSRLSHNPPTSWQCWSELGASAAGKSNISTAAGLRSVSMYMVDFGDSNQPSLGHRRWILSDKLGPIGIGSTDRHSCLYVIGGTGSTERKWTAWPPDGIVPMDLFEPVYGYTLDQTGWSIQSESINLDTAQVSVSVDGVDRPIKLRTLKPYYGSRWALAFRPDGWETTPGVYTVAVTGVAQPFTYDVEVVDCGTL